MTASQVCSTCKGRKKKCDKQMPRCSYCERKGLDCCYSYGSDSSPYTASERDREMFDKTLQPAKFQSLSRAVPYASVLDPRDLDAALSLEVLSIIHACHSSVEDMSMRYFEGLHLWIPFLCPSYFRRELIQFQSEPTAEFALFLLSICLLTYDPSQRYPPPTGHEALYLQVKMVFTQVYVLRRPSVHLIQAGIFTSIWEYAHGRPDASLTSIDICARMAYMADLHRKPECSGWSQAWNTWWAIRIFERIFYCETTAPGIPLITPALEESDMLPHEVGDIDGHETSNLSHQFVSASVAGVGCFGRAAQATYLLDRVIRATKSTNTSQISSLIALDSDIQRLLSATMDKCHGKRGENCGVVGISIRALSILHQHILQSDAMSIESQWCKLSQSALDTLAQMVLDIARSQRDIHGNDIKILSPACNYIFRHALQYLYNKRYADSGAWFKDSDTLREALDRLNRRWNPESGISSAR
ncbi:hypothetical protein BCR34DRAFT_591505 [Clohesyomyces aquaticus]|uniref:Zn(2)-C6 fungal-type domain-containing protein n=1 Tax=Clohesyomyces aquaticus TaxID=1231657 RepID=A0A1Y1Z1G2_9PLEO|nr:hypothetical protein BCR34DRAFT_591505 [Clohesyomyces aquaticus]